MGRLPGLGGRAPEEGLPTASSVAVGTLSAATTSGDSAVAPVSAASAAPAAPVPAPVVRCEAAAAGGLELPLALITTMVAMAATTSPTGTSAVITGWRERNRAGGGALVPVERADARDWAARRAAALDLVFLLVFAFVFLLLPGRAGRDDPELELDMVFS